MFISRGTTKSRQTPGPVFSLKTVFKFADNSTQNYRWFKGVPTNGIQITESDGNRWPPPSGGDLRDFGSEFYTQKMEVVTPEFPHTSLHFTGGSPFTTGWTEASIDGRFYMANPYGGTDVTAADANDPKLLKVQFPPDLSSSRAQLVTKGTVAVAACAPTNQVAHVASSVGELLQDIPGIPGISLWKSRLRAAEAIAASGEEFLNVVFGILPTVSDMTQFITGVHKVDKAVDQFIRDSGRTVRRHYYFPKEVTTTESVVTGVNSPPGYGGGDNLFYPSPGRGLPAYETIRKRVTEREIWFSGAFTYHLPSWFDSHDRKSRMELTAKLLGVEPDLNTVWQLAPWSWAVDWFSDAGAFVKNLQSLISYGTIMRYGYVMETTTTTDTYSAGKVTIVPTSPYKETFKSPYPAVSPVTLRTTTKKRIQANPFGFGLSWDGLSTIQQAIVAALGITRVVR